MNGEAKSGLILPEKHKQTVALWSLFTFYEFECIDSVLFSDNLKAIKCLRILPPDYGSKAQDVGFSTICK